jgi:hypothetical protein
LAAVIETMVVSDKNDVQLTTVTASHRRRLEWFRDHAGHVVPFPQPVPGAGLLATRAKGIYKPADLPYALSVRVMLSSPYADKAIELDANGNWSLDYFQENSNPAALTAEYTNRGMLRCRDDRIPVGVLVQVSKKPVRYEVEGLALVKGWSSGFFRLESTEI